MILKMKPATIKKYEIKEESEIDGVFGTVTCNNKEIGIKDKIQWPQVKEYFSKDLMWPIK